MSLSEGWLSCDKDSWGEETMLARGLGRAQPEPAACGRDSQWPAPEPAAEPLTQLLTHGVTAPQPRQSADPKWGPCSSIGGTDAVPPEDASASCCFIRDTLEEPRTLLVLQGTLHPRSLVPQRRPCHTHLTRASRPAQPAASQTPSGPWQGPLPTLSPGPRVQGSNSGTPTRPSPSSSVSISSRDRGP